MPYAMEGQMEWIESGDDDGEPPTAIPSGVKRTVARGTPRNLDARRLEEYLLRTEAVSRTVVEP
jgi:hypothetical protein